MSTKPTSHDGLDAAICRIMKAVGTIQKDGTNAHQNYKYVSDAQFCAKVQPQLVNESVVIKPVAVKRDSGTSGKMYRSELVVTYKISHGPSGESDLIQVASDGADSGDKATSKAMTGAYKTALRQTFCIPTGDDAEIDTGYSEPVVTTRKQAAPRPAAVAAPARPQAAAPPAGGDHIPECCPKCGGPQWDNRVDKRNQRAPDFKCKDKACAHAIWIDSWRRDNPAPAPVESNHNPSWASDQASFCATLGETCGTGYEAIAEWCEREGWGRPSSWNKAERDSFLVDLAKGTTTPPAALEEIPF